MNSLQIGLPTPTGGLSFTIKAQRDDMRKAFNAWLKLPTNPDRYQSLHNLMTDYELAARLRSVIPRQAPTTDTPTN